MLNTYLNDNQHRPYPLYGGVKLPFPMSCIVGFGLCLQSGDNENPVFASLIAISKTSIRIALCRHTGPEEGAPEFVGMVYADTSGYYTYVASSTDSTVYEVWQRPDPVDINRIVFATFVDPDSTEEEYASAVLADMQVFYSYVAGYNRSSTKSTGYLQVGTIPDDAVGVYNGEFYFDPSCITYMPVAVLGYHDKMIVNATEQLTDHSIDITANGLLTLTAANGTLTFGCLPSTDTDNVFNEYPEHSLEFIEFINGQTTADIQGMTITDFSDQIRWSVQSLQDAVVLTVTGTKQFPNCYDKELDNAPA